MRTSCSSSKSSNYSRAFDLPQDHIPRDDHGFRHNIGGGPMLPVFLNDLRRNAVDQRRVVVLDDGDDDDDLVEVTLELEKENNSVVLCSIAPPPVSINCESNCSLASTSSIVRSFSASSRIGRKFQWLRTLSFSSAEINHLDLSTRDAMKLKAKLVRTKSCAQRALGGLRFINKTMGDSSEPNELWKRVESRFDSLAKDGLLSRHDFADCIGMADSKEFALGVFDVLERRRRHQNEKIGHITKAELHDFWLQITDQSFDARLQIFFDMADSNEDGRVTRNEVQELIMLSASANKLSKLKERAEEYAALIMEELDPENLGYIELWQLEALLLQRENYMNYSRPLSTASVSWSQNLNAYRAGVVCRLRFKLKCLVLENWQRGWILLLWLSVMAGLFVWKFKQYKEKAAFQVMGYCLTTAKGAAETLKLNMALILLPICRNILTFLRSTRARLFIPFNDNINFHKIIAYAIGIGVLIHAGNHMACDFPRLIKSSPEKFSLIASDFNNKKPSYKYLLTGVEGITGISMVILLIVAFTLATPHFRKNLLKLPGPFNRLTGFNAFWFSHHLTALVYILLMVHGNFLFLVDKWYQKTTWMYISAPLLLYVAERCLRTCRSEYYSVKLLKVSILPGDVFNIIMSKPSGFKYKSGQYIFLQCPSISPFEWHPFSITSAPGDDDLSIHIRTVGDWTQELKRVFTEDNCSPCVIGRAKFGQHHVDQTGLPRLFVDGPYGAPAQDYQNYDILLLVGLGIGATPFISILRDLINNTRTFEDQTDSNTENSKSEDSLTSFASSNMTPNEKKKSQRTRSAHFYWVTREPGSFEWFEGVMNEVAEMDHKGHIEMHNYLTSVYEEGDARSTLITMVQALNHAKHGIDILSGTRVRTHFARPNWKEEFTKIAQKHPFATVGVFYCGMPVLAKELKELSHELSHKTSTRFEFHKEYF
ncbi:respiratory burst oxidase-like [Heracleum sosnowskyi]|uniref:Respiratory burst oxidase-like n=1 Tax=Heracleum sosnowskyi TaxID=360622 RepID=A0AAD8M912_9APIA|nr:respiratory burst oxidase-like [Heracleum sosnowskyi]